MEKVIMSTLVGGDQRGSINTFHYMYFLLFLVNYTATTTPQCKHLQVRPRDSIQEPVQKLPWGRKQRACTPAHL